MATWCSPVVFTTPSLLPRRRPARCRRRSAVGRCRSCRLWTRPAGCGPAAGRPRPAQRLGERVGQALGAVEHDHLVDVAERLGRRLDDRRPLLGQLLADDRVLVLGQGVGPGLDGLGLGHALGPHGLALGQALGLGGVGLGLADAAGGLGPGAGVEPARARPRRRRPAAPARPRRSASTFTRWALAAACSSTSLALGLGRGDAGVALGLGQRDLLVGLGVGRLAHGGLQPLLLALGLELGDLGLLRPRPPGGPVASDSGPACWALAAAWSTSAW